jgi:hypothetical protein
LAKKGVNGRGIKSLVSGLVMEKGFFWAKKAFK